MKYIAAVFAVLFMLVVVSCNQGMPGPQSDNSPTLQVVRSSASELIDALSSDGIEVQWDSARIAEDSGGTRIDLSTNEESIALVGYLNNDGDLVALFVRVRSSEDKVIIADYVSGFVQGYEVKGDPAAIGVSASAPSLEEAPIDIQSTSVVNTLVTVHKRFSAQGPPSLKSYRGGIAPQVTCWELRRELQDARRDRDRARRNYNLAIAATAAAIAAEALACGTLNPPACYTAAVAASVALAKQAAARADWLDAKDYYEKLQRGYNASTCA